MSYEQENRTDTVLLKKPTHRYMTRSKVLLVFTVSHNMKLKMLLDLSVSQNIKAFLVMIARQNMKGLLVLTVSHN